MIWLPYAPSSTSNATSLLHTGSPISAALFLRKKPLEPGCGPVPFLALSAGGASILALGGGFFEVSACFLFLLAGGFFNVLFGGVFPPAGGDGTVDCGELVPSVSAGLHKKHVWASAGCGLESSKCEQKTCTGFLHVKQMCWSVASVGNLHRLPMQHLGMVVAVSKNYVRWWDLWLCASDAFFCETLLLR